MSAYAYCEKCSRALVYPTTQEIMNGYREDCPACGHQGQDPRVTKEEFIVELDDRVRALEKFARAHGF